MRSLFFFLVFTMISAISLADINSDQICQTMVGDYSLSCSGQIPKREELRRIRITVRGCLEISFVLEGKETVTGRGFFPSSKVLAGATSSENIDFNDNSIKLNVIRTASWSDDFKIIKMNTTTNAFDASGTNISSKKIIMELIQESDGKKSIVFQNNDAANTLGSSFQSAVCILSKQ